MLKSQIIQRTLAVALLTTTLIGASAPVQATASENSTVAQARAIEGPWEPLVTILDCQTGTPIVSFLSMDSYIRGGAFVAEGMEEPPRRALGLGTWQHVGGRNFTAKYQFFAYNPDGSPLGRLRASSRIRLSADGESFRSTDTAELTDLNGTVLQQICGTREARRLR